MSIRRLIRLVVVGWFVSMIVGAIAAMQAKRTIGPDTDEGADEFMASAIFGPLVYRGTANHLREGRLECWYGGGVLDLRDATLAPDGATLHCPGDLRWRPDLRPRGLAGGHVDPRPRRHPGRATGAGPTRRRPGAQHRWHRLRRWLCRDVAARRGPGRWLADMEAKGIGGHGDTNGSGSPAPAESEMTPAS